MTSKGGRPPIGDPIQIRLAPEILRRVDNIAADHGMTRAEAVRRLVNAGIASGLFGDGDGKPQHGLLRRGAISEAGYTPTTLGLPPARLTRRDP